MSSQFIQLASQYLAQAGQLANTARTAQPQVAERQRIMATRALQQAQRHIEKAIERMGMKGVLPDDGSF